MVGSEKVEKVIRAPTKLPAGWQKATLAEVAEIIMGQSPSSRYYNSDGKGLPFFQGKAEFGELYPRPVKWCSQPNKVAQKDDILISVRAPVGPTNLAPSECCIGRGLAAIRPRDGVPSRYVLYYLRSVESSIDELGTGTTFKAISGGILRSIPIPVAPLAEQDCIVTEIEKQFSRLDEAIVSLKRVKANLKRYKAAVLKAAVEGKLTEDWRRRHPGIEPASKLLERILRERRKNWTGKEKYKEPLDPDSTNLGPVPKRWTWASLEQLCPRFIDSAHRTPQYGQTGVPALGPRDVVGGKLNVKDARHVDEAEYEIQTERHVPEAGDIVYSRELSLGWGAILPPAMRVCLSQGMCLFRPHETVDPRYFLIVLNGPHGRHQAELAATGSAHPHVNLGDIKKYSIPLPPSPEQQQIVAEVECRLSVIEELEAVVEANLTRADRLRQAVLSQAFSGRLLGRDTSHSPNILPTFSIAAESQARYGRDGRARR